MVSQVLMSKTLQKLIPGLVLCVVAASVTPFTLKLRVPTELSHLQDAGISKALPCTHDSHQAFQLQMNCWSLMTVWTTSKTMQEPQFKLLPEPFLAFFVGCYMYICQNNTT